MGVVLCLCPKFSIGRGSNSVLRGERGVTLLALSQMSHAKREAFREVSRKRKRGSEELADSRSGSSWCLDLCFSKLDLGTPAPRAENLGLSGI